MGPLALADLIGLDTCLAILEVLHRGLGEPQVPALPAAAEVRRGRLAGPEERPRDSTYDAARQACHGACHGSDVLGAHPPHREQRAIQAAAREFARTEIAPHVGAVGPRGVLRAVDRAAQLAALGFLGMLIPEAYDGLGLDTCTYLVALEEIAAVDASVAVLMSVHNSLPTQMILRCGTEEQKERFLRPMARGDLLGAFALSEPDAGSDAANMRTQAVRDGDDWVLNGTKAWVSSGSHAGVILMHGAHRSARDRRGARGIGAFLVTPDAARIRGRQEGRQDGTPRVAHGAAGVRRTCACRRPTCSAIRPRASCTPCSRSITGDSGIAAQAIGIARAALEHRCRTRPSGGSSASRSRNSRPSSSSSPTWPSRITASRALLYAAAAAKDRGEPITQFSAMSKLMASETAMWVTTQAIQIFGGYGYVKEYPVERLFRDAKVTEIYEGTSEIQRIVIARELYAKQLSRVRRSTRRVLRSPPTHPVPDEAVRSPFRDGPRTARDVPRQVERLPRHHRHPRHHPRAGAGWHPVLEVRDGRGGDRRRAPTGARHDVQERRRRAQPRRRQGGDHRRQPHHATRDDLPRARPVRRVARRPIHHRRGRRHEHAPTWTSSTWRPNTSPGSPPGQAIRRRSRRAVCSAPSRRRRTSAGEATPWRGRRSPSRDSDTWATTCARSCTAPGRSWSSPTSTRQRVERAVAECGARRCAPTRSMPRRPTSSRRAR